MKLRLKTKIHEEGRNIILSTGVIVLSLNGLLYYMQVNKIVFYVIATLSTTFFLLVLNFFRSPKRRFEGDPSGLVIAPADGTIVAIEEVDEDEYFHDKRIQVSVFMSVFNVHANWFPVNGTVKLSTYHPGRYMAAYLPKSSTENERSTVVIRTQSGVDILMRQIAGALARRIVTYAEEGDTCHVDEHMGFIKFGSRVDLFLPLDSEVLVEIGDKTQGNITALARLS